MKKEELSEWSFLNWLARKKEEKPTPGRMSDEESRRMMAAPRPEPTRRRVIDPDELEARWKDSATRDPVTGLTDRERAEIMASTPRLKSRRTPDEIEALWNASKEEVREKERREKERRDAGF